MKLCQKKLACMSGLFKTSELEKAKAGFRLIFRTELDETKSAFWVLHESIHGKPCILKDNIQKHLIATLNGESVKKFDIQTMCSTAPTERLSLALSWAIGGHIGQKRKGITERDYIHHILMVWYLTALAGGDEDQQIAAILHDYLEDAPDGSLTLKGLATAIKSVFGSKVYSYCMALKNKGGLSGKTPEKAAEKHAWQVSHFSKMSAKIQLIKLCDRLANIFDRYRDGPQKNSPEVILGELEKWHEFCAVDKNNSPFIQAFFTYVEGLLVKHYNL